MECIELLTAQLKVVRDLHYTVVHGKMPILKMLIFMDFVVHHKPQKFTSEVHSFHKNYLCIFNMAFLKHLRLLDNLPAPVQEETIVPAAESSTGKKKRPKELSLEQ